MCVAIGVTDDNYGYIQCKGNGITSNGKLVLQPSSDGVLYATKNLYTILHSGNSSVSKSGQTLTVKINGVEQSLTNTTYSSLKNPNAIKFKKTDGTTVTYDGSSAADLTAGVNYATSAGTATSASNITVSNSDENKTLKLVFHDGNALKSTGGIYCNPSTDTLYSTKVIATNFTSNVATGTQPYACTSTTLNTNLNADLLDGTHKADLLTSLANVDTTTNPKSVSVTVGGTTKYLKVNHSVNT
jgi:hypothetical protein